MKESILTQSNKINVSLQNVLLTCKIFGKLNYDAALYYRSRSRLLNFFVLGISSIAGTLNFINEIIPQISGVLSFSITGLTFVKTYLKYEEKFQSHIESYREFRMLQAKITDHLNKSESVSTETYNELSNIYADTLDRNPVFHEMFLNNFSRSNHEFIIQASKAGILPDILLDFNYININGIDVEKIEFVEPMLIQDAFMYVNDGYGSV